MPVTVTTAAATHDLTTEARVVLTLGGSSDPIYALLIPSVSDAIRAHARRTFAREAVTEIRPGYGDLYLQLERTPIVNVSVVRQDGSVITDWSLYDRQEGTLYRRGGWSWSAQREFGFSGRQRWPGMGFPIPNAEEPRFEADYLGGWILPGQDRLGGTVSVQASDQSFNDSANGFPALLRAGDVVRGAGFANGPNNGGFVVSGTPTSGKIQVSGAALVDEAAGAGKNLIVTNLPLDIEKAAIEGVRSWKLQAQKDPAVIERQLGPARERMSEADLTQLLPLPGICIGLLARWVRHAA